MEKMDRLRYYQNGRNWNYMLDFWIAELTDQKTWESCLQWDHTNLAWNLTEAEGLIMLKNTGFLAERLETCYLNRT